MTSDSTEDFIENFIQPNWPASTKVKAFTTTRQGGVSLPPFDSFNLAAHVNDDAKAVSQNRQQLFQSLCLPSYPLWLNQTHTTRCVQFDPHPLTAEQFVVDNQDLALINADASFTSEQNQVCAVMTADCLPILLCNKEATFVAACHAGWRGLANGIVENTVAQYTNDPADLMAWIGPAISQAHFEVGEEVKALFCQQGDQNKRYFKANDNTKYQFDFVGLAAKKLSRLGVSVYQSDLCSYAEQDLFFSYRRDGQTGRMASLIWISDQ